MVTHFYIDARVIYISHKVFVELLKRVQQVVYNKICTKLTKEIIKVKK